MNAVPQPPDGPVPAMEPPAPPPPMPSASDTPVATPIVTFVIAGLISVVFVLTWITHGKGIDIPADDLVTLGGNFGPLTSDGQIWRLFTSVFLHGGFLHWAMNLIGLCNGGMVIERLIGRGRFVALFLCSGIGGSLASVGLRDVSERIVSVGASGAIFGLYGALGAYLLANRHALPEAQSKALGGVFLGFVIANVAFIPGVDHYAHGGGLVTGLLLGLVLAPSVTGPTAHHTVLRVVGAVPLIGFFAWTGSIVVTRDYGFSIAAEKRWPAQWQIFATVEEKALAARTAINSALKESRIDDQKASARVAEEELPLWTLAAQSWTDYRLGPRSPSKPLHSAIERYLALRVEETGIIRDYFKSSVDAETLALKKSLEAKQQEVEAALEQVKQRAQERK